MHVKALQWLLLSATPITHRSAVEAHKSLSQQTISADAGDAHAASGAGEHKMNKLGALLCWAVVFADIGTSVYYVPGILFKPFGHLAGLFVTLTMVAFVLLALKYAEVSVRFPEGGGVVTVSARALSPWMGALGGMFILVDYFLTAAISSISGLTYFQNVIPAIGPYVLPATILMIVLLGILNWWGIKESAMVSLYIAIAAFISDIVILIAVFVSIPLHDILQLIGSIFQGSQLTPVVVVTGFAGAFLAFSGLESISQLSPVMQRPRSRTVSIALSIVVITVGVTSPLLTILSTTLLDGKHNSLLSHQVAHIDPNQFISQLGGAMAGPVIGVATAVIASALLIFASNTAIIGSYHVFLALSRMSFFPEIVERRDKFRGTPIISIALATCIPIAILIAANGQINLLGELYAFGLLGAFSLTCVSLDALRIRERRGGKQITLHEEEMEAEAAEAARLSGGRVQPSPAARVYDDDEDELSGPVTGGGVPAAPETPVAQTARERALELWRTYWKLYWPTVNFGLGFLTTALVLLAWVTNLITKRDATIFGSSLTVVGMAIAILHYRWRKQQGLNTVQPSWAMSFAPDSVFAIVRTGLEQNAQIIESAFQSARGRKVLVLFLSSKPVPSARIMQINDMALRDDEAQDAFRLAERLAFETRTPTQVFYRNGAIGSAVTIWRIARSQEVVTDVETARIFADDVAPAYIRYRREGDVTIALLVMRPREESTAAASAAAQLPFGAPRQPPPPAARVGTGPSAQNDDDTGSFNDEAWIEEYRDLEDAYSSARSRPLAGGPQQNGSNGHNSRNGSARPQGDEGRFGEEPHPDHDHVGDTKPRHPVKIVHSLLPSQSGSFEAPRPAPQSPQTAAPPPTPKPPRPPAPPAPRVGRMSEPIPLESDEDDWYWNGEDLVRLDDAPQSDAKASGDASSDGDTRDGGE
jgi:amino acid transporter